MSLYDELLNDLEKVRPVPRGEVPVDHLYVVRVRSRDKRCANTSRGRGDDLAVHYPIPLWSTGSSWGIWQEAEAASRGRRRAARSCLCRSGLIWRRRAVKQVVDAIRSALET